MNKQLSYLLAICFLAGADLSTPIRAQAADGKAASAQEAKQSKPAGIPFTGKLGAVDKAAMSITLDGKTKKRTIRLTPQTRIVKAGKPATLDDAVIGEEIGGQAIKNAEGLEEAISLRVGPKPEPQPRPKKNKKDGEASKE
jgi:hypothetical protein